MVSWAAEPIPKAGVFLSLGAKTEATPIEDFSGVVVEDSPLSKDTATASSSQAAPLTDPWTHSDPWIAGHQQQPVAKLYS